MITEKVGIFGTTHNHMYVVGRIPTTKLAESWDCVYLI